MVAIMRPDYYDSFRCVADKCRHNCCVGWEIDIDPLTEIKYKKMEGSLGEKIKENTSNEGGLFHFNLLEGDRCPFLESSGLCEIICEKGEEYLCNICRDHPRYRNFVGNYIEEGLGLCCEEVCRIILENKSKVQYVFSGNIEISQKEQRAVTKRNRILSVLQDRNINFDEKANKIFRMCGIDNAYVPSEWEIKLRKVERLDDEWDKYIDLLKYNLEIPRDNRWEIQWEQLAVYFLFRHYINWLYEGNEKERIQFVINSVKIIRSMFFSASEQTIEKLEEISRAYSAEIEYLEN